MGAMIRKTLAWCVHSYTALGLVAAGGIAVALVEARPESFRWAFVLMLIATVVDATDGTLARAVKVKEVLPRFDGRRLDDLIDFQTYTSLPLLLIWRAGLLEDASPAWLLAPLLASAYGFCQTTAKTDDGYFLGFPSYWNIVAFYVYALQPPAWFTISLMLFFAFMTFVPARYLYPTHRGRLNRWTNWLGAGWAILLVWILVRMPDQRIDGANIDPLTRVLVFISLVFPAYYLAVSWFISVRILQRALHQRRIVRA
ncbi:MAG: CDP-alcohol phosphatidyltransferase [Planctomycetes bacterium]|nr:CDP-alcohol phosphatidyltransferase [Planctomycetota bacterium]